MAAVVVGVLLVATAATLVLRNAGNVGAPADDSTSSSAAGVGPSNGAAAASGAGGGAPSSAGGGTAGTPSGSSAAAGCPADGTLSIATAPDIAPVVADVVAAVGNLPCPAEVESLQPAEVAAAVAAGRRPVEAWIPDSSAWLARAGLAATAPSIASSPVVLAVAAGAVPAGTDLGTVLDSRLGESPIRVGLPDPERVAPALAAVLAMQDAVSGSPDARAALTWGLRSSPTDLPSTSTELLRRAAADPGIAVPTTEQAIVAHNARSGAAQLAALPLGTQALALDYPFVLVDRPPMERGRRSRGHHAARGAAGRGGTGRVRLRRLP